MTRLEIRAAFSLASIYALRMLGLFLVLPVFTLHVSQMPGGESLMLVGIAFGAYGITQAFFHIPFGMASDRYGRKPIIALGLSLFALGSFMAAWAPTVNWLLFARALQGTGAVSAAVLAFAADLTREQHRTKVMALIGSSIGLMFAFSLAVAPVIDAAIGLSGIFALTGGLAIAGILVVTRLVPNPPPSEPVKQTWAGFQAVLLNPQLMRLNFGILSLHLVMTAMFVVLPAALIDTSNLPEASLWKVYLPVVLVSFVLMLPPIFVAERHGRLKPVFVGAIGLLSLAQLGFYFGLGNFTALVATLLLFFVAFNILEASLPSLVSRIAPPQAKGAAMGIYNTTQSLGLAFGGILGGTLAQHFGPSSVFLLGLVLVVAWLAIAASMQPPIMAVSREFPVQPQVELATLRERLLALPGVREVRIDAETRIAYLKVQLVNWEEDRVRQLVG